MLRSSFDAVLGGPELCNVEVAVEDLVLAPLFLEGNRDFGLAKLPDE